MWLKSWLLCRVRGHGYETWFNSTMAITHWLVNSHFLTRHPPLRLALSPPFSGGVREQVERQRRAEAPGIATWDFIETLPKTIYMSQHICPAKAKAASREYSRISSLLNRVLSSHSLSNLQLFYLDCEDVYVCVCLCLCLCA